MCNREKRSFSKIAIVDVNVSRSQESVYKREGGRGGRMEEKDRYIKKMLVNEGPESEAQRLVV